MAWLAAGLPGWRAGTGGRAPCFILRCVANPHFPLCISISLPSAGILQGVKKGMLARAGASIRMQPGCLDLLKQATAAGVPTYALAWDCAQLVVGCLSLQQVAFWGCAHATAACMLAVGRACCCTLHARYAGAAAAAAILPCDAHASWITDSNRIERRGRRPPLAPLPAC